MPRTPGYGSVDEAMGREEKPVCFHCNKLFEFFYVRNRTISFPNFQTKSLLTNLMAKKTNQWGFQELHDLICLYRKGNKQKTYATVPNYNHLKERVSTDLSSKSFSSNSKILHCSFLNLHRKTQAQ